MMPAMMRSSIAIRVVAVTLLGAALPGWSQELQELSVPPLYEVELLVFRHLDQSTTTLEAPPASMATIAAIPVPRAADPAAVPQGHPQLPPAALQLTTVGNQMRRSGRYQPLLHTGWTLPAPGQSQALAVRLPPEGATAGLSGQLTLFRERFLHLVLDLELTDASAASGAPARIHQSRRIRGRNWQYFDHPQYGAIVAVRSPEAGVPAAGGTANSAPAPAR